MKTVAAVAKMPSLDHLSSKDYQRVYEPSDDTFLLCDCLSADAAELRRREPAVCVEVGSGSGCVIAHLASLLPASALLAGDVNRDAALTTRATAAANGHRGRVDALRMDLLTALRPKSVDVLVFNPPYVPTSNEELAEALESRGIAASWAGGSRGRLVLDRMLPQMVDDKLSSKGLFYLLGVAENDVAEIAQTLTEGCGLEATLIGERRAQNERLWVWRFARPWIGGGGESMVASTANDESCATVSCH